MPHSHLNAAISHTHNSCISLLFHCFCLLFYISIFPFVCSLSCFLCFRLPCYANTHNVLPLYHPRNQNTMTQNPNAEQQQWSAPRARPVRACVRVCACVCACVCARHQGPAPKRGLGFGPTRPANKNFLRFTKIGDKKFFVGQTIITLLKRICRLAIARLLPICLHICLHSPAAAEPSGAPENRC